jgi:hypothetical protein
LDLSRRLFEDFVLRFVLVFGSDLNLEVFGFVDPLEVMLVLRYLFV